MILFVIFAVLVAVLFARAVGQRVDRIMRDVDNDLRDKDDMDFESVGAGRVQERYGVYKW